jgi:hypothetical protein
MNEIENGLFAVEETMPCAPRDIKVGRYTLLSTLQRAEREEAAARILTFSQQLDNWVGVSWDRLTQMMRDEFEQYRDWDNAKRYNYQEELRFNAAMRKYRKLCSLTLCLYALFVSKPTKQLHEVPKFNMPFSLVFIGGPIRIVEGLRELIETGMLKFVREGECDVFYPTATLISTIMQKQGLTTA